MSTVTDVLGRTLMPLTIMAALVAPLAGNAQEPTSPRGFTEAQISQWVDEMVAEQVADLGCSTTPALTERVAVRNANGVDTGVVRVVSFDEGWALGTAGKVIVVGWCKSSK